MPELLTILDITSALRKTNKANTKTIFDGQFRCNRSLAKKDNPKIINTQVESKVTFTYTITSTSGVLKDYNYDSTLNGKLLNLIADTKIIVELYEEDAEPGSSPAVEDSMDTTDVNPIEPDPDHP